MTADVVVRNLTQPIRPGPGVVGVQHYAAQPATVTAIKLQFTGGAGRIATTAAAAHGILAGGQGRSGGTNQPGASLASVAVTVDSSIVTGGSGAHGVLVAALGGNGGNGSKGAFLRSGKPGQPGAGQTSITVSGRGSIRTIGTGDAASGLLVNGTGGNGGNGGDSNGAGSGGRGGDGGAGPVATLSNTGDWTIVTSGRSSAHGVSLSLVAGNGGAGHSGAGSGGGGGTGGSFLAASSIGLSDQGDWSISTTGTSSHGIILSAQAGNGGNGGLSKNSSGARGGAGGSGPADDFSLAVGRLQSTTTGDGSDAVRVVMAGGNGGNGGNAHGAYEGGRAGVGGKPGGVSIGGDSANWSLSTAGANAHALFAESIGGNGGNGGGTGIGAGGEAADGADASRIAVKLGGGGWRAQTGGNGSAGLFIRTRGGDGGKGGNGVLANGGGAGNGGQGGNISLDQGGSGSTPASVQTARDQAPGVFMLSEAGNGGNGGNAGGVGRGKNGGWGGGGGAIVVRSAFAVTTKGAASHGIVAQSMGGTGGKGGDGNWTGAQPGQGGSTGPSGAVNLTLTGGSIRTEGGGAYGILVQSVAGHAGDGGETVGVLSFGAAGGSAGDGGAVTISNAANIDTHGGQSVGIIAESIGGGGGSGGASFGVFYAGKSDGSVGGNGGQVRVTNSGSITSSSDDAGAIIAQSIGGTGGNGGTSGSLIVALGGRGGRASNGGPVAVVNSGTLSTGQPRSLGSPAGPEELKVCGTGCAVGILAQSIGGGGGNGGTTGGWFAIGGDSGGGGNGSTVSVDNRSDITTRLVNSSAILAQSLGGGGGNGGGSGSIGPMLSVAIGGTGGNGGNGSDVTVTSSGGRALTTGAADSHGIHAQSIGGGGGNGGFSVAAALGTSAVAVSMGGQGAKGGNGARVAVTTQNPGSRGNKITTTGDRSHAILAQSVGGGGGNGGFAIAAAVSGGDAGAALAIGVGGGGGGGGTSGAVTVTSDAELSTRGADSSGLLAQSIGKGGGNGGFSITGSVATSGPAVNFGLGGNGGGAGNAAAVTVVQTGMVQTIGNKAYGVAAQSLGGGGGNGGLTVNLAAGSLGGFVAGVGGKGNVAGDGSTVNVTTSGTILTSGTGAVGILAQSAGGGGGNGGLSIAGSLALENGGVAFSVGGTGGAGGAGSTVTIANSGAIRTGGQGADGIHAQSKGGGGGRGGLSIAGTIGGTSTSAGATLTIGGDGGGGGRAGKVTVVNRGSINTSGSDASGIVAESQGGGGGHGGMSIGANLSGPNTKSFGLSVGGSGSGGGPGGDVTVTNSGNITTAGSDDFVTPSKQHGIFAQSLGGRGGYGGLSGQLTAGAKGESTTVNASVTVGGSGGSGGSGGKVAVTNSASISTKYDMSHGIWAQSVGGSGGAGGSSLSLAFEFKSSQQSSDYNLAFAIGGKGGNSSDGGGVSVTSTGTAIETSGLSSHGIFATSVGGSGGSGGSASTMAYTYTGSFRPKESQTSASLQVGIGGKGGKGSDGGTVTVDNSSKITTYSPGSMGIYAYSVGGGGGDGGNASGLPTIPLTDRVKFFRNVKIEVGGSGGTTGSGGAVSVTSRGADISTRGVDAPAIYAHSVGGGGGRGGTGSAGLTGTVSVGGTGGAAGDGGAVEVHFSGNISTGDRSRALYTSARVIDPDIGIDPRDIDGSFGIFAQSVGGGGGQAGNASLFKVPGTSGDVTFGVGLAIPLPGGNAGSGKAVTVDANGGITTRGPNGVGILAQSVGGGGGVGGNAGINPLNLGGLVGSRGGNGSGGPVKVTYAGQLTTFGDGATGIFAQSAGGTAALGPAGADVNVAVTGVVAANGNDATAILVQSVRVVDGKIAGAGNSRVTIADGSTVQGGKGGTVQRGAGVEFRDGVANTLTNAGTITSVAGTSGVAVSQSGTGTLTINNTGTIIGSIEGAKALTNGGTGELVAGRQIDLGGGVLENRGRLYVGGAGTVGTTVIDGDLVQRRGSTIKFDLANGDVASGTRADRLVVSGDAILDGTIDVDVGDAGIGNAGRQSITLIETGGAVNADALAVEPSAVAGYQLDSTSTGAANADALTVKPSAVASYQLDSTPSGLTLSYELDFANEQLARQLNDNQEAIAGQLDALHAEGRIDPAFLYLTEAQNAAAYGQALDALSPEPYAVSEWAVAMSSQQFSDGLMGCAESAGDARIVADGQCMRVGLQGRRYSRDSSSQNVGYNLDTGQISIGVEKTMSDAWQVGLGASYENWSGDADDNLWDSQGEQFQGGVVVKHEIGQTLLAASFNGGYADVDVKRNTTPGQQARGNQDIYFVGGQVRAAHRFGFGDWYLQPRNDVNLTWVHAGSVDESSGGASNLDVDSDRQVFVALQPALELGGEIMAGEGYRVRPRVAVGLTHYLSDPSPTVTAGFADAGGAAPFKVSSDVERSWLDVEIGLDVVSAGGVSVGVGAFGQFADNSSILGGGVRMSIPF